MTRPFDMPAPWAPANAAGEICASLAYRSGVRQVPLARSRRDSKPWRIRLPEVIQQPLFRFPPEAPANYGARQGTFRPASCTIALQCPSNSRRILTGA